jgi:hypothetical protein
LPGWFIALLVLVLVGFIGAVTYGAAYSNGLFGIPASNVPIATDIVGICHCGADYFDVPDE